MSINEAIDILESLASITSGGSKHYVYSDDDITTAIDMGIEALEREKLIADVVVFKGEMHDRDNKNKSLRV